MDRQCSILHFLLEKSAMAPRISITGKVAASDAQGRTTQYGYTGSYSSPVRDRLGLLSFSWRATVEGKHDQPEPRSMVLRASESEPTTELVRCRIETAIVEHLECKNATDSQ